jgi:hypothetical protein
MDKRFLCKGSARFFPVPVLVFFAAFALSACAPPAGAEKEGKLKIILSGGGSARSLSPQTIAALSYRLECSGPGGETQTWPAEPGTESLTLTLKPGDWILSVQAFTPEKVRYGLGETGVIVEAGKTNEAVIEIYFVPVWHVSPGGNDETGAGSEGAPFATIHKALDTIKTLYIGEWSSSGDASPAPARILVSGTVTEGGDSDGMILIRDSALYEAYPPIILEGGPGGGTLDADANASSQKRVLYIKNGDLSLGAGLTLTKGYENTGGGVYVSGGKFTMKGGTISGNITAGIGDKGGGVYVTDDGTFVMDEGIISNNETAGTVSASDGGGVYTEGTFIMNGGTISGNKASAGLTGDGGGVYVASGQFTMNGGTISGNTASGASVTNGGGGVYVDFGTFTMTGGTISGNEADGVTGSGGGVHVDDAVFVMTGGSIDGNQASGTGGGVYVASDGSFRKTGGGIIYGNDAEADLKNIASSDGDAVYVYKLLSLLAKKRNSTAGSEVNLDSESSGAAGGWE